jgi:hypothetical protein
MPEPQRPQEDRDEVLNPAVERRQTECRRRQMGGCCVVEDTDQKVDRDEKPSFHEKEPYISGDSLVCAAPGGDPQRNLSSPPSLRTLELLRDLAIGMDSAASRRPFGPYPPQPRSTWHFQQDSSHVAIRRVDMPDGLSPMQLDRVATLWAPIAGKPDSHWRLPRSVRAALISTFCGCGLSCAGRASQGRARGPGAGPAVPQEIREGRQAAARRQQQEDD